MDDKRDECGCHRTCTTLPHACEKPCGWPSCLTEDEAAVLDAEILRDWKAGDLVVVGCPPGCVSPFCDCPGTR